MIQDARGWCIGMTSLFFKTPFPGWISIPTSFVFLFIFYILSYLLLKTMVCFSGCLRSSASIQKLFCGICLALKCSFDEFVGEKVVSQSYSSAISGPPPSNFKFSKILMTIKWNNFNIVWFLICVEVMHAKKERYIYGCKSSMFYLKW